jgi:hypothetical protein
LLFPEQPKSNDTSHEHSDRVPDKIEVKDLAHRSRSRLSMSSDAGTRTAPSRPSPERVDSLRFHCETDPDVSTANTGIPRLSRKSENRV